MVTEPEMALVPAVTPDDPALPGLLDDATIRLRIGRTVYGIPLRDIGAGLDGALPSFVTGRPKPGEPPLNVKQQAFRSGIKALIPMGLTLLAGDVEKFGRQLGISLPLPDLKSRKRDLVDYAARYLAALVLSILASQTWEAEIGETVGDPESGAGGYLRLTRVPRQSDPARPPDAPVGPDGEQ